MYHRDETDKLTRLLNETFLEEGLNREIKRAQRYERPLVLMLIDPGIPEEHFQDVGYLALKKIASIVRENTRYLDIKVRVKNKILILLPETDITGAKQAVKKIQQKIDQITFREFPNITPQSRISLSSVPEDGQDRESLMESLEKKLQDGQNITEEK